MLAIRTILHPTDFSDHADNAFRLACALARDYGARLVVVHVARRPIVIPMEGVVIPEPEGYEEPLMDQLQQIGVHEPDLRIEHDLVFAVSPAVEIVEAAQQRKVDLIVMGTHGRTGLGRLVMGSVAEQVLREAPCPVVTVKNPLAFALPVLTASPEMTGAAKE